MTSQLRALAGAARGGAGMVKAVFADGTKMVWTWKEWKMLGKEKPPRLGAPQGLGEKNA